MNDNIQYSFGHKAGAVNYMTIRTAERNAQFALPYLAPGQSLLDCGCGPGSITIGLAARVAPGEVIGIDLGESQVQTAAAFAKSQGVTNARFEVASVSSLPFEDESFDFIFSHTLLCHVTDVDRALAEMRRVLRKGGCIALRDISATATIHSLNVDKLRRADSLISNTIRAAGGDPDIGSKLGPLLHRAGFVNLHLSASYDFGGPSPAERLAYFMSEADLLEQSQIADACIDNGWATREEIANMAQEWRKQGSMPGALFALPFGEAVGWKPA